jgi:HAMP domain-containing protein/signal transduction histidine kinase/DNA-binding response OmpR family regulator
MHEELPPVIGLGTSERQLTQRLETGELLAALQAVRDGDFSVRLPGSWRGMAGKIADTFNEIAAANERLSGELRRVGDVVGRQGKTGQRVRLGQSRGAWDGMEQSINGLLDDLLWPLSEVTRAISAVAQGDLRQVVPVERGGNSLEGEFLRSATIVNRMIERLGVITSEVTRVARAVGVDGELGGQAEVDGAEGVWHDMTANVNSMAGNLTAQVRNISEVTIAVASGDLSKKITVDVRGEILQLKEAINTMVDQLRSFASEVTRVAREVGTEGKLGGQAIVPGVAGTWKDLTDSVNAMCGNLTDQVRKIAQVTTAVARGDLSHKITVDVKGEILELKNTINTMVDQLNAFASEVTRVAREVGTDGKLGGQAEVPGVAGTWKDLTDNVNSMAGNLTSQVRNIAEVATAIARGDLSRKITVDAKGEIRELKETVNTMVDQLNSFASEVTRVAYEVGTEGKLGGQAEVPGVAGTWKSLTDSVNSMADNLTDQVRNIAAVTTAVARGDLSRKITVDVKGEILELTQTINTMVDQLNAFAAEVTRVAREVGTEGKLGGQAEVPGVAGTWKDLTDSVNSMAGNLTAQVRNISDVAVAIASGDLSKKITADVRGEILLLKETLNTMVDQLNAFAAEVTRVAREVGTEGKLGGQAEVAGVAGTWKDLTDNVNLLAGNLTAQVRNIAEVTTAVARGDLSRKITVDARGEILELKSTINTMVDQLGDLAAEVTRVAREVGTEGLLGGQAQVPGAAGTWRDLTDNVNVMAANLTEQVRGIVQVVTAVASGNLERKLTVRSKGEVAALAETINNMIDTLATFADQVTTVAREVGIEGRLGGQANVPGALGIWKDLTGNVNRLAANLTTQVRAIAEVGTAVTKGDLTRSIQVEARGEVADLKDNINTMIGNLRLTTERYTEQDWLKTNLARFTSMLQGQRDLAAVGDVLLTELVPLIGAHQGIIYQHVTGERSGLALLASYGNPGRNGYPRTLEVGEGFIGQCAKDKRSIIVETPPPGTVPIDVVLLPVPPRSLVFLPILFEGGVKAVLGLASLHGFTSTHLAFLEQLVTNIGIVLNSIEVTMRTESLLSQSQELAVQLQEQKRELQVTNDQLALKARELADQNVEVERKNEQIELARRELEEKAAELALTSKYKSDFLANMSHELRTPLNSILILGQQLSENPEGNLSGRQVEFAQTIYGAGSDLLNLITDILDLSKVESGTVTVESEEIPFSDVLETAERSFRHEAEQRELWFNVVLDPSLAGCSFVTDSKRLLQILKNLLSNAFKFTEQGGVDLSVRMAMTGWTSDHPALASATSVVSFEVRDTGVGVPAASQRIIFEAFQQADASMSRRYGGTGLGLAISRELAGLLGGEIRLVSAVGRGSTFTLFLPLRLAGSEPSALTSQLPVAQRQRARPRSALPSLGDDGELATGEPVLLVVEDDPQYASVLVEAAQRAGIKALVAAGGAEALAIARRRRPLAILLDQFLPDALGWTVLSELKQDLSTMHIPVQVLSVQGNSGRVDREAVGVLAKSASPRELDAALARLLDFARRRPKRLLIVDGDSRQQIEIMELVEHDDIEVLTATAGQEALALMRERAVDCLVLDLRLPDGSGFEVLESMVAEEELRAVPVVVFTGRELSAEERERVRAFEFALRIAATGSSERLLDHTAMFLHRDVARLPADRREAIERLHRSDDDLGGRSVLIVDDDVRNIFVLSSVLEQRGMNALTSTTGDDAIRQLQSGAGVDLVLMDIMMPEMNGFEAIRAIRAIPGLEGLPIVALTAKAMKGDREKCLEAGASDYLAKPVEMGQLLTTLRAWLR